MRKPKMVHIKMEDAEIDKDRLWFFAYEYNGLYCADLTNGEVQSFGMVPNEEVSQMRLYSSIKKIENKIFLIPNEAKELAVFDIDKRDFKKIDISEQFSCDEQIKYMGVASYENRLYIFGLNKPVIIEIDADSCKVKRVVNLRNVENTGNIYFRKQVLEIKGKLYVPFCLESKMLELDCKTLQSKIHCIESMSQGYAGISSEDGIVFCFSPMYSSGHVVKWDRNKGVIKRISSEKNSEEFAYVGINRIGPNHVLFPAEDVKHTDRASSEDIKFADGNYSFVKQIEYMTIAYETNRNCVCFWDESGKKEEKEFCAPIEYTLEKQLMYEGKMREKRGAGLGYLFETINEDCCKEKTNFQEKSIGEKIYRSL